MEKIDTAYFKGVLKVTAGGIRYWVACEQSHVGLVQVSIEGAGFPALAQMVLDSCDVCLRDASGHCDDATILEEGGILCLRTAERRDPTTEDSRWFTLGDITLSHARITTIEVVPSARVSKGEVKLSQSRRWHRPRLQSV